MTAAIGDYAIIGDGKTSALVAPTGSIDFLCWPRFDSDACMAALLGDERHGFWRIAPAGFIEETTRRYRGDTLILETIFRTDTGRVRLTEFMPWQDGDFAIVRIAEGLAGQTPMTLALRLRFGFGQVSPWMQPHKRGVIAEVGPDRVVFDSPVGVTISDGGVSADFTVESGDRLAFILTCSASTDRLRRRPPVERLLKATEAAWTGWIEPFDAPCRWPAAVKRSLLTLRALVDRESGGVRRSADPGTAGDSRRFDELGLSLLLAAGIRPSP